MPPGWTPRDPLTECNTRVKSSLSVWDLYRHLKQAPGESTPSQFIFLIFNFSILKPILAEKFFLDNDDIWYMIYGIMQTMCLCEK